ncbi:glycosyltransferase [archaeon]|jgi:cellulose synthase/poly-beta-1,6-N-acetylglucosamine synthase-like glycosyltransferase|nr:glycosyltransferase [archaeon]MBT4396861.1 glycosyltransferase [archaeon]MBT4441461.1 glycosyltransferase [archaeon]
MITIIITAYKEEKTVGRAIECFLNQKVDEDFEILVACPDEGTKKVVDSYSKYNVRHVEDPGKGKPIALNICFKEARGDKIILTDGDVHVSNNAIEELMKKLNKKGVGAVTGRPVSINSRASMLGYFSHLLTDLGAHDTRRKYVNKGKFIVCSGYLFAMKNVLDSLPEDALSDDAVMTHMIHEKGYKIGYAPEAKVYVKYPTNFKDWIIQKKRSAGGYNQLKQYFPQRKRMRSFWKEIAEGWYKPLTYPRTPKEVIWTLWLYMCRLYLWFKIYQDINLKQKKFEEVWVRVESTK